MIFAVAIATEGRFYSMKKNNLLFSVLTILFAVIIIAVVPTDAEGAVYEDTVRLHILANSDSEEDQALKIRIRDAILTEFGDGLSDIESTEEARLELTSLLPEIEEFARAKVKEEGYSYTVSATLGEEWYETREYEDFTLPRGYYTSLRVIIGEGEGKNWWCVMFPPLCLDMATEDAPRDDAVKKYSNEEFVLITKNGYNAKFKALEIISAAFK